MHMSMVVVTGGRHVNRSNSIDCWFIMCMVVTVLVAVMPEMGGMARSMFQRIADTHYRRVGGVQRKYDGKKKREESAHDGQMLPQLDNVMRLILDFHRICCLRRLNIDPA